MIGLKGEFVFCGLEDVEEEVTVPNNNYNARYNLGNAIINGTTFDLPTQMVIDVSYGGTSASAQVPMSVLSYDLDSGVIIMSATTWNGGGFDFSGNPAFGSPSQDPPLDISSIKLTTANGQTFAELTSSSGEVDMTFNRQQELIVLYIITVSISQLGEHNALMQYFRQIVRTVANVANEGMQYHAPAKVYLMNELYFPLTNLSGGSSRSISFDWDGQDDNGDPSWKAILQFQPSNEDELPRKMIIMNHDNTRMCSFTPLSELIEWSEVYQPNQICIADIYFTVK